MEAMVFLVNTLFSLYLMVVLLRLWLQLAQADFYNQFSQFIVKATHPLVGPMRRVIPSFGRIDTATLVLALLIALARTWSVASMQGMGFSTPVDLLIYSLTFLLAETMQLVFWILIIRAILSWVSQGSHPLERVLHQLTEPMLHPIRRILPSMGGLDLSPMVLIIGLMFLMKLLGFQ